MSLLAGGWPLRNRAGFFLILLMSLPAFAGSNDWKPVSADELALNDSSLANGSNSLVLDWETFTNDLDSYETVYYRIKIFTDAGKKSGDIEIPFLKDRFKISDIQARTIHSDGKIIPFSGEVFEKTIVKFREFKYLAKTFSMSDVQPGSIIEYRYRRSWDSGVLYSSHWTVQDKLPVRHARFVIKPYLRGFYGINWITRGIGQKTLNKEKDGTYSLDLTDIPAFVDEAYIPPESELKPHVELFYTLQTVEEPDKFWKRIGKEYYEETEKFVGNRGYIRDLIGTLVAPSDPPESKLRKLYARAQQVTDTSYEHDKSEEAVKRENRKDNNNVEDVLRHGYGNSLQINLAFLALARAAGFEAHRVEVGRRDEVFFQRNMQDARQLNGHIIEVKLPDKTLYLDPAVPHCPFGSLRWSRTGVAGLRLEKDGGTFIQTPNPKSDEAMTERKALIRWNDEGIKGQLMVTYKGQAALMKRISALDDDEETRKSDLEDEAESWLPSGSSAKVKEVHGMDGQDEPVVVIFDIEVPNFGATTGKRMIVPLDVFVGHSGSAFQHDTRKHPIYFQYPYQEYDQIFFEVPAGYQVEKMPTSSRETVDVGRYATSWTQQQNMIVMQRRFALDWFFFQPSEYPKIKDFFSKVYNDDQESAVLHLQK
jgi:hypothetical protein